MKDYMKRLCIHEVLVNSEDLDGSGMCPKVVGEEVLDAAEESVDEVKGVVGVVLSESQSVVVHNTSRNSSSSSS